MIKTIIVGNLICDPELKEVNKGSEEKKVCTLAIASNRAGKDKADILKVEVWNKQAENCQKYLTKGSGVCAVGDLEIDSYIKDDEKRISVKLINAMIEFTDRINNK